MTMRHSSSHLPRWRASLSISFVAALGAGCGGDDGPPLGVAPDPLYAHTADTLYTVDPDDPTMAESIGRFLLDGARIGEVTDLAIDDRGGMYAVTFEEVFAVDPETAAVARLMGGGSSLNALTSLRDGTLLAGGGNRLFEVDEAGQMLAPIDSIGSWNFAGDMVGLPDGLLYCAMSSSPFGGATTLVVYDPDTQEIVRTAATGTASLFGFAYADGTLFGFAEAGSTYTIDPETGQSTLVASGGPRWYGAATNPTRWGD